MVLPPRPLARYETSPLPSLTDDQVVRIVAAHGLDPDGPIERLERSGVVHSLWALGSRWVLRVPKDEPMCLGDHRCEAVAIPMARRAGLVTPDLVVFDDSLSILDVPYSIVERVDGTDLTRSQFDHPAYEQVGRQLAALHAADLAGDEHPWLRAGPEPSPRELFDEVLAAGLLHEQGVDWLRAVCDRLDGVVDAGPATPRVFTHADIKPDNLMIDAAGRVQLIDWGDARFGDPAVDFQALPMASIATAMAGYRAERAADPTLEARVVRCVVGRCLSNLRRTPLGGPSWYRPIAATITDLLTFAVDDDVTWARWTGGR